MRTLRKALLIVPMFITAVAMLWPAAAFAHEDRDVGKYEVEAGFWIEPVPLGQPNGAFIEVKDKATKKPIEGLGTTLKVEVSAGGRTQQFDLTPLREEPGAYVARFTPTATGQYVFRFFGAIEGLQVNERFESGPGRFNEPVQPVQFPQVLPDPLKLQSDVQSARTLGMVLGIIGIAVGAIGVAAGGAALMRKR